MRVQNATRTGAQLCRVACVVAMYITACVHIHARCSCKSPPGFGFLEIIRIITVQRYRNPYVSICVFCRMSVYYCHSVENECFVIFAFCWRRSLFPCRPKGVTVRCHGVRDATPNIHLPHAWGGTTCSARCIRSLIPERFFWWPIIYLSVLGSPTWIATPCSR